VSPCNIKWIYFRLDSLDSTNVQRRTTSILAHIPGILALHNDTITNNPAIAIPDTPSISYYILLSRKVHGLYIHKLFLGSSKDPRELPVGQCCEFSSQQS
jgi:hypothetical protein